MNRPLALAALLAPLALGCDAIDSPPREVWTADFTELEATVAPEQLDPPPADCGQVNRWTYTYDDAGHRTVAARYSDRRIADRVEQRTFDDAGRIVRGEAEWEGGYVDVTLDRDPDGRITRRVVDASDSSMRSTAEVVERSPEREVIRYSGAVLLLDPYDPMTERRWDAAQRADLHDPLIDGGAMIDALVRRIEAGEAIDPLFDPFEVTETRTFDASGRPLRTEWELDSDGLVDQTRIWTWLDDLDAVTITDDFDANGVGDHRVDQQLDPEGRIIEETIDVGADGVVDVHRLIVRGDDGEIRTERTVTTDEDGVSTARVVSHRTYQGVETTEVDELGDGTVDHVTTIWRRDDGQRVLKHEDAKADNEVDWQRRYVYDTDGREVYSERDRDVDGVVDLRVDYGWSADGRLLHAISTEPGSARCGGLGR